MKFTSKAALALLLLATACAHHKDVRAGASGVHTVRVKAEDEEGGSRSAIKQANHYCKQYQKEAAFIEDKGAKYTGDMDEKTYKKTKRIGRVAQVAGAGVFGVGSMHGARGAQTAGGIIGIGGAAADAAAGEGYTVEMTFKCQ